MAPGRLLKSGPRAQRVPMTDPSKRRSTAQSVAIVAPLIVGLLLYPVTLFFARHLVGDVPAGAAAREILGGGFDFWVARLAAVPFALLSAVLFVQSWRGPTRTTLTLAIGGLVGICWVLIPGYFSLEASFYRPERPSSTAALGYLFAPLHALPFLSAGLLVGWGASRLPGWSRLGR